MGASAEYRDEPTEVAPFKSIVRDYVETILVCVIFVIFVRAFVFQQSEIPSGSMEDTILIGDYVLVNRFLYAPTSFSRGVISPARSGWATAIFSNTVLHLEASSSSASRANWATCFTVKAAVSFILTRASAASSLTEGSVSFRRRILATWSRACSCTSVLITA